MTVTVPAILDAFDFDGQLELAKARVLVLSGGRWTDTSNTDPGIVAIRVTLEIVERWLYSLGARYVTEDVILHLATLLGIEPDAASRSGGVFELNIAPGTLVQAGFQVGDEQRGIVYQTKTSVTSAVGGAVKVEIEALEVGSFANTDLEQPTTVSGIRSTPTTGTVYGGINLTYMDGGGDGDTVDSFRTKFPQKIQNTTIVRPEDFERRALTDTRVGRARCYPATKPGVTAGTFEGAADHVTVILLGKEGGVPAPSVLADVLSSISGDTLFNLFDANPAKTGLHIVAGRLRSISITAILTVKTTAKLEDVVAAAKTALLAFTNPITGGDDKTGYALGEAPGEYEIGAVLEAVVGVKRVKSGSLVFTGATNLAVDEIVSLIAANINLTAVYA
jgi:Baseplate J-like protein